MNKHHRRIGPRPVAALLFLAGITASIVMSAIPAGAQEGITILGSGGSDELGPPPSPTCDDLVFITEVSFDAQGNPLDSPRFGTHPELVLAFDVPGFEPVGPGVLELDEVILHDAHFGRDIWPAQLNEQVWFEFLLDGVQQAKTSLTPDVPDGQLTSWIDVDMGSYELPNGADTLRIHHAQIEPVEINSLVVSALCGHIEPFADGSSDTADGDSGTDDGATDDTTSDGSSDTADGDSATDDGATDDTTTDGSSTDVTNSTDDDPTDDDSVETEVQGQVEEPAPELAITGRTQDLALLLALVSIAFGAVLVRVSARARAV